MTQRKAAPTGRAGPVTLVTVLYALAYLVWERAGWGGAALRGLVGDLAFMPLNLTVAVLMLMAARRPVLDPRVQRGLRLFGLGCVMVLIGNGISLSYSLVRGSSPAVSWADLFYLADSVFMLAALLAFPVTRRTRQERIKFMLDAATVLIGGAIVIWFFTVLPTTEAGGGTLFTLTLALAYPLASLMVLYGATAVVLRGPLDTNRLAFRLLLAAVLVSVVADLAFDLVLLNQGVRTAVWTDAVYLLYYVLATAAAEQYLRHPAPRTPGNAELQPRNQGLSPLPYVAIATVYGLLLAAAITPWTEPISGIAVGAVLMTALVVIRQLLAVQQNIQLLADSAAESRFRSLVQHSSDVILVTRSDGAIRFASPSVSRLLMRDPALLGESPLADLLAPEDRGRASEFLREAASATGMSGPAEWRFHLPDGSVLHTEILATNLLRDPSVRGIVLNGRDISERKRLEAELTFQAFHDPLTGLANRALFLDRVSHALTLARRQGRGVSLLYLDLDDFKQVNDRLGHAEGDLLLTLVAERLQGSGRAGDTVARLGGDEFAILVEGSVDADGLLALVERCQTAITRPFQLGSHEVRITVSTGIATAAPEDSADDLLRNADMAMYNAKRRGKGRTEKFQPHTFAELKQRIELEAALRAAIAHEGLSLMYLPTFSLATGRLEGVEAQVRWAHPRLGTLLPGDFMPLAEETGLIVRLGEWVLLEACRQVERWRSACPAGPLTVGVNISARQLQQVDIVHQVEDALAESGIQPSAVVLEITETMLLEVESQFLPRLTELRALGVRLAIDDFGTGYSSLGYLQRGSVDTIKIAQPFVEDVAGGADKSALARAIIGLGKALNIRTLAKGIQRAEQCAALMSLGCELGQGDFFAQPLTPDEVLDLLRHPRSILPRVPVATRRD